MAQAVHVNGEASIKVNTGSGLSVLGVSEDGVDIEIEDHIRPVHSDTTGPEIPFEEQIFLQTATVRCTLIFYDESILLTLRQLPAGVGVEGQQWQAGTLMGANSYYFRLLILSPNDGLPWNFPKVRVQGSRAVKLGTVRNGWRITFYSYGYGGVSGATNNNSFVLYNRIST